MALFVDPSDYFRMRRMWEETWAAIDRVRQRNDDKDPDEALRLVTEIVEEVRQQRYEERQAATSDDY